MQIRSIKSNLKNSYVYIIADNSDNMEEAAKIRNICYNENIVYIKLPSNPYSGLLPSTSHGASINWIIRNVLYKIVLSD
jgi:hypothetical protein